MPARCLTSLAAALLAAALASAMAQGAAPTASTAASAPVPAKPGPRLQTPEEVRDRAASPGDLRPEERVVPQIVVPLRKNVPPPTKAERAAARRGIAASAAGIDDAAARCDAQASKAARAECRAALAPKKARP